MKLIRVHLCSLERAEWRAVLRQRAGVRSAWGDFLPTEVRITEWSDKVSWGRFMQGERVANSANCGIVR